MAGLDGIDVVVLAGGLGTRIQGVLGDTPKVLAPVGGRPFLDRLLEYLAAQGAGRVILALGHRAEAVVDYLRERPIPLPVLTLVEPRPLGTGGALRFVAPHVRGDPVLVVNGDTWLAADLAAFLAAHRGGGALVSLLCVDVPEIDRYGSVDLDGDGRVVRFVEKDPSRKGPGLVNGGVVLLARSALAEITGASLERDFLATLPPGSIQAHVARGAAFIDIGTPESLAAAAGVPGLGGETIVRQM